MEYLVKIVAPRHFGDFVLKLVVLLILCGLLNHLRDVVMGGPTDVMSFLKNLGDATWTALPMCTFALLLIRHLNKLQSRLYQQATTDALTGIPNRRWFFDHCGAHILAGQTLVLFDIDFFKQVNDTFGHDVGDRSLQTVAEHISTLVPAGVKCARLGGEEFGVLLDNLDQTARDRISAICAGILLDVELHAPTQLTLSAGVFEAKQQTDIHVAFRQADAALYHAKSAGRAQFVVAAANNNPTRQTQVGRERATLA